MTDASISVWVDGYPIENRLQRGIGRVAHETLLRSSTRIAYTVGLDAPLCWPEIDGVQYHNYARRTRGKFSIQIDPSGPLPDCPIYHSYFFVPCPVKDRVVVQHVHDMIPERLPGIMGRWGRGESRRKKVAIDQADALICLSDATRQELLAHYPYLADKPVFVVHPAGDHLAAKQTGSKDADDYVLYVGHRHVYKNFRIILKAMATGAWPRQLRLVAVGRPPNVVERALVARYRLGNRVAWHGVVDDDQLGALYQRATALLFPSLMEGFGIPVIESQANRCPLVCSDIAVFREVAGEAAVFFDPHDPNDLCRAVSEAAGSRAELIQSGLENLNRFSWQKTADRSMEVYRALFRGESSGVGHSHRENAHAG